MKNFESGEKQMKCEIYQPYSQKYDFDHDTTQGSRITSVELSKVTQPEIYSIYSCDLKLKKNLIDWCAVFTTVKEVMADEIKNYDTETYLMNSVLIRGLKSFFAQKTEVRGINFDLNQVQKFSI